jgi:manganese-dependent inorganic pyrophosphatase
VGDALMERSDELLEALRREREDRDLAIYALMVTDVADKGTEMLVAGDVAAVARSFGVEPSDSVIELPGVMSRKKEVAPKLMTAL